MGEVKSHDVKERALITKKSVAWVLFVAWTIFFVFAWAEISGSAFLPAISDGKEISFSLNTGGWFEVVGNGRIEASHCSYFRLHEEDGEGKLKSVEVEVEANTPLVCDEDYYWRLDKAEITGKWKLVEGSGVEMLVISGDETTIQVNFGTLVLLAVVVTISVGAIAFFFWYVGLKVLARIFR